MNEELIAPLAVVGTSIGAGMFLGYKLCRLVDRIDERLRARGRKERRSVETNYGPSPPVEHGFPQVTEIGDQRLQLIPMRKSTAKRAAISIPVINDDRDDVVAALVGAGYKKSAAVAAADACELPERLGGIEAWTAAALRRVSQLP